jgi:hypothetical protein
MASGAEARSKGFIFGGVETPPFRSFPIALNFLCVLDILHDTARTKHTWKCF